MKAYEFIINSKFLDNDLVKNAFYFRIDFKKFIEDNKVLNADEFVEFIKNSINEFEDHSDIVINKLKENGFELENDESKIWQNSYKNLVLSKKGIITNIEDFEKFKKLFLEIKKDVLSDGIFIKLINYVDS